MPIHLVGDTIDKSRSHYLADTGRLVQLMRGIYADAADDIDATVQAHASASPGTSIPTPTCRPQAQCSWGRRPMVAFS